MSEAQSLLAGELPKLQRTFLKDRVVNLLRDRIVYGDIDPGAKVAERDLAHSLGISRIPVRDALLQLEREGLVVNENGQRRLVELTERDVLGLYFVRSALERSAVELAANNRSSQSREALLKMLEEMRATVLAADARKYATSDIGIHRMIWLQADNPYLLKALEAIMFPLLMFLVRAAESFESNKSLRLHEELVAAINAGNVPAAQENIVQHLEDSKQRVLQMIRKR